MVSHVNLERRGGQGENRTPEVLRHLVYSQAHLTALVPAQLFLLININKFI